MTTSEECGYRAENTPDAAHLATNTHNPRDPNYHVMFPTQPDEHTGGMWIDWQQEWAEQDNYDKAATNAERTHM